ncbi:MAG TPA: hypothetical protein VN947_07105 [Polyangia bacterium]|nr:hypothetical protein [Polyangia bacterium]
MAGRPRRQIFMIVMERPSASRVIFVASLRKLNLSALGAVLVLAAVTGQLGLIFGALVLYSLLVIRDVSSPQLYRRLMADDAAALRQLPETAGLRDEGLRVVVCSLRSGWDQIRWVVARTPAPIRAHLRGAIATLDELRAHAASLIRTADELHRYLEATPRESVVRELKTLRESMERAEVGARAEYEKALAVREEQLTTLDRIKREHDRRLASLQRIIANVEAFPSRIRRIELLETCARQDETQALDEQLLQIDLDLAPSMEDAPETTGERALEGHLLPTR